MRLRLPAIVALMVVVIRIMVTAGLLALIIFLRTCGGGAL